MPAYAPGLRRTAGPYDAKRHRSAQRQSVMGSVMQPVATGLSLVSQNLRALSFRSPHPALAGKVARRSWFALEPPSPSREDARRDIYAEVGQSDIAVKV